MSRETLHSTILEVHKRELMYSPCVSVMAEMFPDKKKRVFTERILTFSATTELDFTEKGSQVKKK